VKTSTAFLKPKKKDRGLGGPWSFKITECDIPAVTSLGQTRCNGFATTTSKLLIRNLKFYVCMHPFLFLYLIESNHTLYRKCLSIVLYIRDNKTPSFEITMGWKSKMGVFR